LPQSSLKRFLGVIELLNKRQTNYQQRLRQERWWSEREPLSSTGRKKAPLCVVVRSCCRATVYDVFARRTGTTIFRAEPCRNHVSFFLVSRDSCACSPCFATVNHEITPVALAWPVCAPVARAWPDCGSFIMNLCSWIRSSFGQSRSKLSFDFMPFFEQSKIEVTALKCFKKCDRPARDVTTPRKARMCKLSILCWSFDIFLRKPFTLYKCKRDRPLLRSCYLFFFFLFRIFAAQWVSASREAPLCSYHYLCSMFASTPYAITIVFLFASLSFFYDSFLLKSVNRCVSPDLAHTGAAMLPQSRCCSILVCKCVRSTFCRVLPKTSLPWSTRWQLVRARRLGDCRIG